MIFVQLNGGLGNQLFQYAAGKALAMKNNTELLLDLSLLGKANKSITPRNFELHNFKYQAKITNPPLITKLPGFHRYAQYLNWCTQWKFLIEKKSNYVSDFLSKGDQNFLIGFWQSYQYFDSIADKIFTDLEPRSSLSNLSQKILSKIQAGNAVGVHIRRGDYVSLDSAKNYHGALPMSYYQDSIDLIRKNHSSAHFYFFSDDPQWCNSYFQYLAGSYSIIDHNVGNEAWQDLILMSWCPNQIIANSSFSWWAAWLGDRRFKDNSRNVIVPSQWFLDVTNNDLSHRIPLHWSIR
jgi:hypothetical protein